MTTGTLDIIVTSTPVTPPTFAHSSVPDVTELLYETRRTCTASVILNFLRHRSFSGPDRQFHQYQEFYYPQRRSEQSSGGS